TAPLPASEKLYIPALQTTDGVESGFALMNVSSVEAWVTLTAWSYDGAVIQADLMSNPVNLTIPPSGVKLLRASEIFGAGILGRNGWVELTASTPAVKGLFLVYDSKSGFLDASERLATPTKRLFFPNVSAVY